MNNNPLRLLYCNARSFTHKVEEIVAAAESEDAQLLLITETWFESCQILNINGYCEISRDDRIKNKSIAYEGRGGGVAIYCKEEILRNTRSLDCGLKSDLCQQCGVTIGGQNIILFYRSPSMDKTQEEELMAEWHEQDFPRAIWVGDVNLRIQCCKRRSQ